MKLPIIFQSLDRLEGREGKSKLLHCESKLYKTLHGLKQKIATTYTVGSDRMDLHIEITKERRDPAFRSKAESINGQEVDLADPANWGYLGRGAFILRTPVVEAYGGTHITVSFFGRHPHPQLSELVSLMQQYIRENVN